MIELETISAAPLRKGIIRTSSFTKKATTTAAVIGATAAAAMAELPEEFAVGTHMTTLAGYVFAAAGAALGVFIAIRAVKLIAGALKSMMH